MAQRVKGMAGSSVEEDASRSRLDVKDFTRLLSEPVSLFFTSH